MKRYFGWKVYVLLVIMNSGQFCHALASDLGNDSTAYFNIGSTSVKLPSGKTYATDTIGMVCSVTETGTYGGWKEKSHPARGFFYADTFEGNWCIVDPEGYEFIAMSVTSVDKGGGVSLPDDLKRHYLNSLGNWCDLSIPDIPNCPRFNFLQGFKNTSSELKNLFDQNILPVFDSEYENYCNTQAALFVSPFVNNSWVLGYFTDNELTFHKVLLDDYLALDTINDNYKASHNWMVERKGSVYTISENDRSEFRGFVASTYASAIHQGLKQHDPNHMILGPRLHASGKYNEYILRGIGPFIDIMGINFYSRWDPDVESMDLWLKEAGKPFLITEFYTKGMDTGLPNASGAGWEVYTQQDRAWFFENFALALLSHPGSVGWQWFRYIDKDGVNKGIISEDYKWYTVLLESMNKIGKDVYNLRRFLLGQSYDPVYDPECDHLSTEGISIADNCCRVFPNPAMEIIAINSLATTRNLNVSIYNSRAEKVFQHDYCDISAGSEIRIDRTSLGLNPGLYFIRLVQGEGIDLQKLILL